MGFFLIECSILGGLIYAFVLFSKTLKDYNLERYIKVKNEMQYFMVVWVIPLSLSIIVRFILMLESTGICSFADHTRNSFRTL